MSIRLNARLAMFMMVSLFPQKKYPGRYPGYFSLLLESLADQVGNYACQNVRYDVYDIFCHYFTSSLLRFGIEYYITTAPASAEVFFIFLSFFKSTKFDMGQKICDSLTCLTPGLWPHVLPPMCPGHPPEPTTGGGKG